jgi:hypothetical protein
MTFFPPSERHKLLENGNAVVCQENKDHQRNWSSKNTFLGSCRTVFMPKPVEKLVYHDYEARS